MVKMKTKLQDRFSLKAVQKHSGLIAVLGPLKWLINKRQELHSATVLFVDIAKSAFRGG